MLAWGEDLKLGGIEASRGVAALLVVMFHAAVFLSGPRDYGQAVLGGVMQFGRAGVDFFFVLSGFIISYVHALDAGRPAGFVRFWRKRLWRIYPTYWVVLAIFGCLLAVSPTPDLAERDPGHVVASILLLPVPAAPILGVAWSLRYELVFYAMFSLVILHRRLGQVAFAAWFLALLCNAAWSMHTGAPWFADSVWALPFRLLHIEFFFGLGVAWLVRQHRPWRPWAVVSLGVLVFLANGMFESFGPWVQDDWPPRHLLYALGAAMVLHGLATLDRANSLRVPAPLLELGAASYSLYLVHPIVLIVMQQALRYARPVVNPPIEVAYLFLIACCIATGVAFSRVVERPLLRASGKTAVAGRSAG